jgi:hypothetical protein
MTGQSIERSGVTITHPPFSTNDISLECQQKLAVARYDLNARRHFQAPVAIREAMAS